MKNQYHLTQRQNIFLAKKLWEENIYCGAKLEGSKITFPETQTILNGVNVPNATLDDIQTILNLRDAWKYLLQTIEEKMDLNYSCKLNEYIARNESLEWGVLRNGHVGISGTDYKPEIPKKENVVKELENILNPQKSAMDQALDYFLYGTKSQLFWDGNKRTSLLCANKILIAQGAGVLTIPDTQIQIFNENLVLFYNTGEGIQLKEFLYNNCIKGIDIPNEHTND